MNEAKEHLTSHFVRAGICRVILGYLRIRRRVSLPEALADELQLGTSTRGKENVDLDGRKNRGCRKIRSCFSETL